MRYDPANLHDKVWVYALTGEYLAEAEITEKAGFGDQIAGREHNKAMRNWVKHTEKAAKERAKAEEMELSNYAPTVEFEERFLEMLPEPVKATQTQVEEVEYEEVLDFNAVRKVPKKVEVEAEEISEFEQAFMNAVAMKRKI